MWGFAEDGANSTADTRDAPGTTHPTPACRDQRHTVEYIVREYHGNIRTR
jgi:hypothetical protein